MTISQGDVQGCNSATNKTNKNKKKLRGLSPQVNYTDRATVACQRS
jgi:hypothetical protein